MTTYSTIMTAQGKALVAAAAAAGKQFNIVSAVVGDGGGNATVPSETQTKLVRQVYSRTLNSITQNPADPSQYKAEFIIPADVGGFTLRELGLVTDDGVLVAAANVPQFYKPSASEGSYSDMVIEVTFKVANASTVQVVVDPNISIATRTWVMGYAVPANIIPGGLKNQFLTKRSNTDGDVIWTDPTAGVQVIVDTIEEKQTLAANQTTINLADLTTHAAAVYINGERLPADAWVANGDTIITLKTRAVGGETAVIVQNEQTGMTDVLHAANNLQDVQDKAASLATLGGAKSSVRIVAGSGLSGGGSLADDRTLAVTFAGDTTSTLAVRDDDPRMTDTRVPKAHPHDAGDITSGTLSVPRGGTGNASVTAGYFLMGNGTSAMLTRSPAQMLSDIGAASASHTHNIADVNGLQTALDAKAPKASPAFTGTVVNDGGALPTTGSLMLQSLKGNSNPNVDYLNTYLIRDASGTAGWGTALWRMARVVDSSTQGYMDWGSSSIGYAMRWGVSGVQVGAYMDYAARWTFNTQTTFSAADITFTNGAPFRFTGMGTAGGMYWHGYNGAGDDMCMIQRQNANSSYIMNWNGIINVTQWFNYSDRRLKFNIKKKAVTRGLALHIARGYSSWQMKLDGSRGEGAIAQWVQKKAPHHVDETETKSSKKGSRSKKRLTVNNLGMAVEMGADNALHINELESVILKLTKRIEKLESRT